MDDLIPKEVRDSVGKAMDAMKECVAPFEQRVTNLNKDVQAKEKFEKYYPILASINDALNPLYHNSAELNVQLSYARVEYVAALPSCAIKSIAGKDTKAR